MALHVVLVEPAGALNVGSVARLCANFGAETLRLVAPRCDPDDPEARRMAMGGRPLLAAASRHRDLSAALSDCRRVVACSGRGIGEPLPPELPRPALQWLLAGPGPLALVFGREDRGLSNDELLQAGRLLRIPAASSCPSLNLSHAVAVVLYELQSLSAASGSGDDARQHPLPPPADPCPRGELEALLADAEALLLAVGFLWPHTARPRMRRLRALLQRSLPSRSELALLRGIVAQMRWASRHSHPGRSDQDH